MRNGWPNFVFMYYVVECHCFGLNWKNVYCSLNGKNCSTLWLNGISLAVFGIGGAMFCVPALADMNDSAL